MKTIITTLLVTSSIVLVSGVQAASIDDFNGGWQEVEAPGSDTVGYSGAIGADRNIDISITYPNESDAKARVYDSSFYGSGVYSHSADDATAATSIITWDDLEGVDITDQRVYSVFSFEILSVDGEVDLTFLVEDGQGNSDSQTLSIAKIGMQAIAFDKFDDIDFTDIDFISLTIEGGAGADLALDNLRTVPTPATMILILAGLTGFFFTRKQQGSVLTA